MNSEKAYAKLNLALHVKNQRHDHFHNLEMIVVPLALHDELTFKISEVITLDTNIEIEDNAILKTAYKMKEMFKVKEGVHINLQKHIPIGSGLGGESADIAATIRGLNTLWNLELSSKTLEDIALLLGSDTKFCLFNKPALVTGRGEHLSFIDTPPIKAIYLCISEYPVSTKEAFKKRVMTQQSFVFESLFFMYQQKQYQSFFNHTYNDLFETACTIDPTLKETYLRLKKAYEYVYMTGSGSTLFVLEFDNNPLNIEEISHISGRKVIKTVLFN